MDKVAITLRNKMKSSEDNGFKFAITLITVCISIMFIIHNYAENNLIPILSGNYVILSALIILSVILLLYIGTYIFFKGISLETNDFGKKEKYESLAKHFYVEAFKVVFYFVFIALFDQLCRLPSNSGILLSSIIFSSIVTFRPDVLDPIIDLDKNEPHPKLRRLLSPIMQFISLIVERYVELKHKLLTTKLKPLIIKLKSLIMKFKSVTMVIKSKTKEKYVELKPQPLSIKLLIFNWLILLLAILITIQIFHATWIWVNWIIDSPLFIPLCAIILFIYTFAATRYVALKPITIKLLLFKFSIFALKFLTWIQIILALYEIWGIFSHVRIYSLLIVALYLVPLISYVAQFEILRPLELAHVSNAKYFISFMTLGAVIFTLILPSILYGHLIAEMNSIYYKQDKQIPVDISVTGFRNISSGVFVDLYRTNSNNLTLLDSIDMRNKSSISHSAYIYCNNVGLGRYKVFIDCSNFKEGYYMLSVIYGNDYNNRDAEPSIMDGFYHDNERVNNSFYLVDTNTTLATSLR